MEKWQSLGSIGPRPFKCGYCGTISGSRSGYFRDGTNWRIYICSNCARPTFFEGNNRYPGEIFGSDVEGILSQEVEALYREARLCTGFGAYTATVLACRKILMHIAVEKGAKSNQSFESYVEYLSQKGYIPPDGKIWVDQIRKKGNEANHEILLMNEEDAKELIGFTEMLLKFIYEFPARIATKVKSV